MHFCIIFHIYICIYPSKLFNEELVRPLLRAPQDAKDYFVVNWYNVEAPYHANMIYI